MNLLMYDDSPVFGGHEVMAVRAAEALAAAPSVERVTFLFFEGNGNLRRRLEAVAASCPRLRIQAIPLRTRPLQGLRNLASPLAIRRLRRLVTELAPDVALVVQGNIEVSSLGLLACHMAGIATCSYIPMGHSYAFMGAKFGRARDLLNRVVYYSLPHRFLTVSESMATLLRDQGVKADVAIIPNYVPAVQRDSSLRAAARNRYHIAPDVFVAAVVGRIHFQQKAQDFVVEAMGGARGRLSGIHFLFVGSGPHERELQRLVTRHRLQEMVHLEPWTDDVNAVLAASDALLIPSRFEGVPLVMLEAMSAGLPIIAADVDGMREVLPREWLFRSLDRDSLVEAVLRMTRMDNRAAIARNRKLLETKFTQPRFAEALLQALQFPNGRVH